MSATRSFIEAHALGPIRDYENSVLFSFANGRQITIFLNEDGEIDYSLVVSISGNAYPTTLDELKELAR